LEFRFDAETVHNKAISDTGMKSQRTKNLDQHFLPHRKCVGAEFAKVLRQLPVR
jgi:hypothetical protein